MTVLVFGGNGFVGCEIMQRLAELDIPCTSVSRSGERPAHLKQQAWAEQVNWLQGDAAKPDPEWFSECSVVITLVGSPPVPTFSDEAYQRQVFMNGITNKTVIEHAAAAGIKNVVLMSADIPKVLQKQGFGYYVGKQLAIDAALQFAEGSGERRISVLKPSSIYGTRHTKGGTGLPLSPFMYPMSKAIQALPQSMRNHLMAAPVSVAQVAEVALSEGLNTDPEYTGFKVWECDDILNWPAQG